MKQRLLGPSLDWVQKFPPQCQPTRKTPDMKQRHLWGDFQLQQLSRLRARDIPGRCSNNVVSCGVWLHRGLWSSEKWNFQILLFWGSATGGRIHNSRDIQRLDTSSSERSVISRTMGLLVSGNVLHRARKPGHYEFPQNWKCPKGTLRKGTLIIG